MRMIGIMTAYDKKNDRLVMYEHKASVSDYWEKLWESRNLKKAVMKGAGNYWLRAKTKKYLKPGSVILEAGCGRGQNVYGLKQWGYDAYGVDFASETISRTKNLFPGLKLSEQDVRKLDFEDNFFDGMWSLGVIEHFWEGYDDIIREAHRVLKPGGYLLLTVPWISPMRRRNIQKGVYETCPGECSYHDNFYQFILSDSSVRENVEEFGFEFLHREGFDALKGIKSDKSFLSPFFEKLYGMKSVLGRGIRFLISLVLKNRAGHVCFYVFRKK